MSFLSPASLYRQLGGSFPKKRSSKRGYKKRRVGSSKRGGAYLSGGGKRSNINKRFASAIYRMKLARNKLKNHHGGTGPGGRGKPSKKQLAARALFTKRFGHR